MKKFKTGDMVRLKSGGPNMTVFEDIEREEIGCSWFIEDVLHYGMFHEDQLDLISLSNNH